MREECGKLLVQVASELASFTTVQPSEDHSFVTGSSHSQRSVASMHPPPSSSKRVAASALATGSKGRRKVKEPEGVGACEEVLLLGCCWTAKLISTWTAETNKNQICSPRKKDQTNRRGRGGEDVAWGP